MTAKRGEPFLVALEALRSRLAAGVYGAESRLAAAELAAEFGLSPTPMREALSRLAGEGLLEDRRGQGFFLRRLTGRDVADLYRLAFAHLRIALDTQSGQVGARSGDDAGGPPMSELEVIGAVDEIFSCWVAASGGRVLTQSFARVQLQLARARRHEPQHIDGLAEEWAELAAMGYGAAGRLPRVRGFFARRIRVAGKLADSLEIRP